MYERRKKWVSSKNPKKRQFERQRKPSFNYALVMKFSGRLDIGYVCVYTKFEKNASHRPKVTDAQRTTKMDFVKKSQKKSISGTV